MSLPLAGFFGWGRAVKNTVLLESFLHSDFFTFFYFYTFSLFLHFLHFQIFSLFHFFTIFRFFSSMGFERVWTTPPPPPTFLHFYNFSEVTLVVVFFLCGEMLKKIFLGGGLEYSRGVIFTFRFFHFFFIFSDFFTFFTFLQFSDFFTFYIFTFLQFFRGHSPRGIYRKCVFFIF